MCRGTIGNLCDEILDPQKKKKCNCSCRTVLPKKSASSTACHKLYTRWKPSVDLHSTHPHHFEDASAAGMSPATAAADLVMLGVSTSTLQDNIHFLAGALMALMLR